VYWVQNLIIVQKRENEKILPNTAQHFEEEVDEVSPMVVLRSSELS
jgi:hypothetical protein